MFFFAKQKGTSKWNMEACKQRGGNDITLKRDPMAIQSLVQDRRKSPTKVRTSRDSCGHSKTTTLWRLWSSLLWDHHQHHRVEDDDDEEEEKKSSTIMSNGMKPNCLIAFERLSLVSLSDIQHTHPRQLNWRRAQNFPIIVTEGCIIPVVHRTSSRHKRGIWMQNMNNDMKINIGLQNLFMQAPHY